MELKQIEYFLVLAQELNFTQAAKRLHISQPPLSRHIKALEQELDTQLFVRDTNSVKLTRDGEIFYEEAQNLFSQVKEATHKLKSIKKGFDNQISVNFVQPAFLLFLPDLLKAFQKKHPRIQVNIQEIYQIKETQDLLSNNHLDIAFVYPSVLDKSLTYFKILTEPIKVVLPLGHHLAKRKVVTFKDLKDERFIFYSRNIAPMLYDLFLYECAEAAGFEPEILMEVSPQQTRVELVKQGLGITFTSASIEQMYQGEAIFKNLLGSKPAQLSLEMVWNPHNTNPALDTFINFTKNFISSLFYG